MLIVKDIVKEANHIEFCSKPSVVLVGLPCQFLMVPFFIAVFIFVILLSVSNLHYIASQVLNYDFFLLFAGKVVCNYGNLPCF